ncbi:MAG: prepilin-type N-terminal cleavage/methylation domain-containing protein [Phycisphaerales bacterium]|nr:prepilin-type N-terminal cleavage/methylation domain-containing protein [Phycisphaerales bacterium]
MRKSDPSRTRRTVTRSSRRGLTLLESLIATTILSVVVLAVAAALNASQKLAYEGRQRVMGVNAADDMMVELMTVPYAELKTYNGLTQAPGAMATIDGTAYPETYTNIGRSVEVVAENITEPGMGITVAGVMITVRADDGDHTLAELSAFRPEPQS